MIKSLSYNMSSPKPVHFNLMPMLNNCSQPTTVWGFNAQYVISEFPELAVQTEDGTSSPHAQNSVKQKKKRKTRPFKWIRSDLKISLELLCDTQSKIDQGAQGSCSFSFPQHHSILLLTLPLLFWDLLKCKKRYSK